MRKLDIQHLYAGKGSPVNFVYYGGPESEITMGQLSLIQIPNEMHWRVVADSTEEGQHIVDVVCDFLKTMKVETVNDVGEVVE